MDLKLCNIILKLLFCLTTMAEGKEHVYRKTAGVSLLNPFLLTQRRSAVSCVEGCSSDERCLAVYYIAEAMACGFVDVEGINNMVPTTGSVVYHTGQCDFGWKDVNGRCLLFVNSPPLSWQDSETNCLSLGGHLANVYSAQDFEAFPALCPNGCQPWLGINDLDIEGQLVDITGQNITNDVSSMLAYNSEGDDCSYFTSWDGTFNMYACGYQDSSICEKAYLL